MVLFLLPWRVLIESSSICTVIDSFSEILFGVKPKITKPKTVFEFEQNITTILDVLSNQLSVSAGKATAAG